MLPKFEENIVHYFKKLQLSCGIVNRSVTIAAARGIISVKNRQVLAERGGPIELKNRLAQSFLRRFNFVRWEGTKAARKIPEKCLRNKRIPQSNLSNDLIINFDQTNVYIVPMGEYTYM